MMAKLLITVLLSLCLNLQICSGGFCSYEMEESEEAKFARSCAGRLCRRIFENLIPERKEYKGCCQGYTGILCLKKNCIKLPQDYNLVGDIKCLSLRTSSLLDQRAFYRLTQPLEEPLEYPSQTENLLEAVSFPVLDQNSALVVSRSVLDPSLREAQWVIRYLGMAARNKILTKVALKEFPSFTDYSEYDEMLRFFRDRQDDAILSFKIPGIDKDFGVIDMEQYMRYPSQELPFEDIIKDEAWQNDNVFVQQRLAGLNPMALRKMKHEDFQQDYVNRDYDWDAAMERASGEESTFKDMIDKGKVFIIDYKDLYDVANVDDYTERNTTDRREMRGSRSPFCVFVSANEGGINELKAVAIQHDLRSDAPVSSPIDGSKWLLAKEEVQRADITYAELVEHLLKTHLLMEPICVIMRRAFSVFHPLHQVMNWHCRGLFVTNSLGIQALLLPENYLHKLFTIGHIGAIEVLNRAYPSMSWDDTEFDKNLQRRGVDNVEELPYFPYRDDGLLSWKAIGDFSREYIDVYYSDDKDVVEDMELADFANQISADGTGENGGSGMIKKFPVKITTKEQLVDVFKRILFIPIQHHAVNYPVAYYGAYVPNLPTKLYDDPRVPHQEFGFHTLPQSHVSAEQMSLSMSLGSLRYDVIFDYKDHLKDFPAQLIVEKYHKKFVESINDEITKRNDQRLADGKMSYPYLLPKWMPNSIHT